MYYETKVMFNSSSRTARAFAYALAAAIVLLVGAGSASAQRDPFAKPSYKRERKQPSSGGVPNAGTPVAKVDYGPPAIEARIEYFKHLREQAAASGQTLPKVTSVLTLNEMAVTGIFKTPRGYAAMVEATPIKLSYTIYPGEKFFDGQLVAVEENRLVFRKVTKTGPGKFVASVENKPLRQFSLKSQVEGTAPAQSGDKPTEPVKTEQAEVQPAAGDTPVTTKANVMKSSANPFLSPLDEMNSMPEKGVKESDKKKPAKKPAKLARNRQ